MNGGALDCFEIGCLSCKLRMFKIVQLHRPKEELTQKSTLIDPHRLSGPCSDPFSMSFASLCHKSGISIAQVFYGFKDNEKSTLPVLSCEHRLYY
jgi:hypothetical protein